MPIYILLWNLSTLEYHLKTTHIHASDKICRFIIIFIGTEFVGFPITDGLYGLLECVDFVGNPVACNMKFIFINMDTCDLADSRVPREMK